MKKIKVLLVFGTRPEATKMCPLVLELKRRTEQFETIVCVTAQHREMLDSVLKIYGVNPDYDLNIMRHGQTLSDVQTAVLKGIEEIVKETKPDIMLVHGDTTTSMAAALSGFYNEIKVGHVEAGLRTYNKKSPYPEEMNRQLTGCIADIHFAPTEAAKQNLLNERKNPETIFVTGNTSIDCLKYTVSDGFTHELFDWLGDNRLILMTTHRRENLGEPMRNIFKAVLRIVSEHTDVKVIFPMHLNPKVREIADEILKGNEKIKLIEQQDARVFHNFMNRAYIILTDSGGLQEEAPALNKPVIVMRDTTERPEGIEAGTLKLAGLDPDEIFRLTSQLLTDREEYERMANAVNPYGDGNASKRIAEALFNWMH